MCVYHWYTHIYDTYYTGIRWCGTGLPGCFAPQWGHGITLCRPPPLQSQGSQTIITLGLLQSKLNTLRWCTHFIFCNAQEPLPGAAGQKYDLWAFLSQVWWQVCQLKWALDDSRDFLSQVCEVWTHLRKLSEEKIWGILGLTLILQ